jgi:phosphate transport system permease protein
MADGSGRPAPRLRGVGWGDVAFRVTLTALAATIPLLFLALVARLAVSAWPAIRAFGVRFLTTSTWDPVANVYGAAPMIFGTLFSSVMVWRPHARPKSRHFPEFRAALAARMVGTPVECSRHPRVARPGGASS